MDDFATTFVSMVVIGLIAILIDVWMTKRGKRNE
jgi:hypothetical protein